MSKQLSFSKRATKDIRELTRFYKHLYGKAKTDMILFDMYNRLEILYTSNQFSEIGVVYEKFNHLKSDYRKFFHHKIKVTYKVSKNDIIIVRVFDARQNPKKNL